MTEKIFHKDNKINRAKKAYKKQHMLFNKKGSSLILAIVVIATIAILSTLVLSLSLNAYRTSIQNKWADEDFYYCEECLEDVYGVVVAVTNDIFLDNYKHVLTLFTSQSPDIINKSFREGIRLDLRSNEVNEGSDLWKALNKTVEATDNDGNVVGELVVSYEDTRYTEDPDLIIQDFKNGKYVFKNVKVEFWNIDRTIMEENQKKFYSSVTTDIVIYIPDLVPSIEYDNQGALAYIIVSGQDIKLSGNASVSGNVYAGKDMILDTTADVRFLSDYISICNQMKNDGKISITGSSATANIWCKDLLLKGNGSSTIVSGNMFVNDDMQVDGDRCTVQIAGKYYGYGDGTDNTKYAGSNGGSSTTTNSAILVNGEGTLLDMMSIRELVISGHSFFPVDGVKEYSGAESLATIVSQSIYMVDENYIDFPTRTVKIGGKSLSFDLIKDSNGKSLVDLLTEGYTLITGGVDLSKAKVKVGNTEVTENLFASSYLVNGEFVTLGHYTTDGKNYCSLYWNFEHGDSIKGSGSDIVAAEYITNIGATGRIDIAGIALEDVYVYNGGDVFTLDFDDENRDDIRVNVGEIFGSVDEETGKYKLTDRFEYTYTFDAQFGNKLPSNVNLSSFKNLYLVDDEPVRAVITETEESTSEKREYKLYLQWNFDSSKIANRNKGDAFISACIEAGLIDGFLEKFMDGGYIKIGSDASVSTTTDFYEYIVGEDGYAAKKYGVSNGSLFGSSMYSKNFVNAYKWYMTTLVPEKYDPFSLLAEFDNEFSAGEKYSVFTRNSYYLSNTGVKEDSEYINFSTIDNNGVGSYEMIVSTDGKYKNLIVNGNLTVSGGVWTAGGAVIEAFNKGMIFVDGNVEISDNISFSGMIICNGEVKINGGSFTAEPEIVEGCLETLKRDLNPEWWPLVSDEFYTRKQDSDIGTSSLNAVDCIRYENWTRNRDRY